MTYGRESGKFRVRSFICPLWKSTHIFRASQSLTALDQIKHQDLEREQNQVFIRSFQNPEWVVSDSIAMVHICCSGPTSFIHWHSRYLPTYSFSKQYLPRLDQASTAFWRNQEIDFGLHIFVAHSFLLRNLCFWERSKKQSSCKQ